MCSGSITTGVYLKLIWSSVCVPHLLVLLFQEMRRHPVPPGVVEGSYTPAPGVFQSHCAHHPPDSTSRAGAIHGQILCPDIRSGPIHSVHILLAQILPAAGPVNLFWPGVAGRFSLCFSSTFSFQLPLHSIAAEVAALSMLKPCSGTLICLVALCWDYDGCSPLQAQSS